MPRVLILGIGNLLWADEGFGVRAVEALNCDYEFPPNVRLMDGGTQGLYLIEHVTSADILIVFDAVDYGLAPGSLKLVEDDDVPKFLGAKKMSLHQTGFQEVLATAALLDKAPKHLFLIGVQPVELEDYGGSLRAEVKAQIPAAIRRLRYIGRVRHRRHAPRSAFTGDGDDRVRPYGHVALRSGTSNEEAACRTGDARFLEMLSPKPGEGAAN